LLFESTSNAEEFPKAGEVWALGFGSEGKLVGKIGKAGYDQGTHEIEGLPITCIASVRSIKSSSFEGLLVLVSIEYPASVPVSKRQKLEFYTRVS
jgi:hypothetical protein